MSANNILTGVRSLTRVMNQAASKTDTPGTEFDEAQLRQWLTRRGGYVHPALRVVENAPCGARGVIATEDISFDEVSSRALIVVPAATEITVEKALHTLEPLVPSRVLANAPLHTLDAGALVALLLAHERNKGSESDLFPYISSLPSQLSCPWALPPRQVEALLAGLAADPSLWADHLQEARRYLGVVSQGMGSDYSEHLRVSPDDIMWAIGIVSSRGYGGELRPGLVPYIDMVNHNVRASSFIWTEENDDAQAVFAVWSAWDDKPRPLKAGEELYVDYKMGGLSPLDVFLSHGFVPDELWE
eukprot:CAMPEP_0114228826 /NCGR_PEP_ID=MMETSP0058-20121206/2564_1 /TAXON_ID=36894 /ORGANISM="Pyramimonas parkeae, CCMP726" /LENGTH=301 /DNA_ID=CAMNT_0001339827 /DNA_START=310 /DNA_END=1216 /DNA_ORIENTATION=-